MPRLVASVQGLTVAWWSFTAEGGAVWGFRVRPGTLCDAEHYASKTPQFPLMNGAYGAMEVVNGLRVIILPIRIIFL